MKNLKRALSLVLATVMVIGMMVVGASAVSYADFTDKDEVVNAEAVALLNDLGIIEGIGDGSYRPEATIDRAGMAKLICKLVMGNVNPDTFKGTETDLTDINGHWAEGYIKFCYVNGIIAGYNGKFAPNDKITVVGAAKMLLTALGYNAGAQGYVDNANWTVNVMRDANTTREWTGRGTGDVRSLVDGVSASANADLTRDMAAQMIFNALFVANVEPEYQWDMGQQYVAKYTAKPSMADTMYNGLYAVYGTLTNYGDSNETMVDGRTVRAASLAEDVGTTVVYYKNTRGLVSSVAVSANADEILGTSFGGYTLANLSTRRNAGFIALADSAVTFVYQNGIATEDEIVAETTLASSVNALVAQNGVITELIDTDNNGKYDVVRITEKTVANVTSVKVTTTTDGDKLLTVGGIAGLAGVNVEDVIGYEDIASGDVALYYQDVNGNWFVEAAEAFNGVLTAGTAGTGVDAASDPDVFTISAKKYTSTELAGYIGYVAVMGFKSTEATYYLDNGGNIVYVKGETEPKEYLMVLKNDDYSTTGDPFSSSDYKSQVLFTDGKVAVIDVDDASATVGDGPTKLPVDNGGISKQTGYDALFSYTVNKDGSYKLTKVPTAEKVKILSGGSTESFITNGRPAVFDVDSSTASAAVKSFNTDSETVYFVRNFANGDYQDSYTVYTGYENVPSMEKINGVAYVGGDTVAEYVFINKYATIDTAVKETVYSMGDSITAVFDGKNVDYYTVKALVDGEVTDLILAANAKINGTAITSSATIADRTLYTIDKVNADGEVLVLTSAVQTAYGVGNGTHYWLNMTGTNPVKNDVLVLGNVAFSYNKDTVVYFVYGNNTVVEGTVADIGRDTNDVAQVVVASADHGSKGNTLASTIYVEVNAEAGTTYDVTFNENFTYVLNGAAAKSLTKGDKLALSKTDVLVVSSTNATAWKLLDVTATTGCTVTDNGDGTWTLTGFNKPVTVNATYGEVTKLSLTAGTSETIVVTVNGEKKTVTATAVTVDTCVGDTVTVKVVGTSSNAMPKTATGTNCTVVGLDGTYTIEVTAKNPSVTFGL